MEKWKINWEVKEVRECVRGVFWKEQSTYGFEQTFIGSKGIYISCRYLGKTVPGLVINQDK